MTVSLASLTKLAALGLSTEQMEGVISVLAVELAPLEKTRALAVERQARYLKQHGNVRMPSIDDVSMTLASKRHNDVMPRVEDNNLPSLITETVRKEEPPISPPLPSKPLSSDHPRFSEFWEIYPKRAGDASRKPASKAFTAACRRTDPQTIIDGTKRYAGYELASGNVGTQFVSKARNWLNDEAWTNTYETPSANHKPNSIAGGIQIVKSAIARQLEDSERELEEAEGRGRDDGKNPETIPRLRQGHA